MGLPNNISPLQNGGSPFYTVNRSLRFRSSATAYLNRTPSASSRTKFTFSAWVKRGSLAINGAIFDAYSDVQNYCILQFFSDNTLSWYNQNGAGTVTLHLNTTQVFRDPSAWYHILVNYDSTQATSSNRAAMYINGVQVTAFGTATYPSLNTTAWVNAAVPHDIGRYGGASNYFDGYLAEVNFIDGQQLTPSSFGSYDTNGIWQPLKYTGSYGTNGFYLPFNNGASTTTLGYDASGNGNNWTTNNISLTSGTTYDWMQDVPTNNSSSAANFAVLNPLNNSRGITISNANLKGAWGSASDSSILGTISIPSSGKFYAELTNDTLTSASVAVSFGLGTAESSRSAMVAANMWVYYASNQSYIVRSGTFSSQIGSNQTIAANGILQVAIDRDNNQAWLGYNNVWVNATNGTDGNPSAGTNPTVSSLPANLFILCGWYANSGSVNFGQRPFSYTPPTGYNALNTANLPTPLISNGAQYMAATTYSGQNTSLSISNAVNGVSFQPDFVWIKKRSGATDHNLTDSVRGSGKNLISNSTAAEDSVARLTSFDSGGVTLAGAYDNTNLSGSTYVGWQWKAGAGSSSSNTSGSITSTVSVNQTAGFSVVTYTGTGANATVGHGLGVAPSMIIIKNRTDGTRNWQVYHANQAASPANGSMSLNLTNAYSADSTVFNNTVPTSTVFSIGTATAINGNTNTFVAYCFAAVSGYSAMGSYVGNSSTDGPFIFLGFRARFILLKSAATANEWYMWDTSRNTYNVVGQILTANSSAAEYTATAGQPQLDILSNGFKIRDSGNAINSSNMIYAAFAENPFQISRGR